MRIQVSGAKDLYRLAHALHEARQTGLKRELDRGSREAGQVIAKAVTDPTSMARYIPKHFEGQWSASMEAKVEVRLVQSNRITIVFWARGKATRRDIVALNRGVLKHPVFGRRNRFTGRPNPWVKQVIKPGLVDEPAKAAMPKAVKKLDEAVHRVTEKIGRAS